MRQRGTAEACSQGVPSTLKPTSSNQESQAETAPLVHPPTLATKASTFLLTTLATSPVATVKLISSDLKPTSSNQESQAETAPLVHPPTLATKASTFLLTTLATSPVATVKLIS